MNTLNQGPTENSVSPPEDIMNSDVERLGDSCADLTPDLAVAREAEEQTERATETFPVPQSLVKQPVRVAIKVRGKILFINLGDVVSVQAAGNCVWLQRSTSSYLLREPISVVAETLETHGFIRIHRSVLVNTAFVEEIKPLSTGEYCLRVEDGKEYTVTRTYKKNLKSLAQLWMGTGALFPG